MFEAMEDNDIHTEPEGEGLVCEVFNQDPSKEEKIEMRKAVKTPSEWLKLLCKDWAKQNVSLVDMTDAKFLDYKPYLRGLLTSQLLTQVERFSAIYCIQHSILDDTTQLPEDPQLFSSPEENEQALAAAASSSFFSSLQIPSYNDPVVVAAAAAAAVEQGEVDGSDRRASHSKRLLPSGERGETQLKGKQQRQESQEKKEVRNREREIVAAQKASEKAEREASRDSRKRTKDEIKMNREKFAREQKEAALCRAAELVASNRVPIELVASKSSHLTAQTARGDIGVTQTKTKSAIVVSTASDLHRIVSHANDLYHKYSLIAKEHQQKVSWSTVARELGIHVKVREKYFRMHARAEQRDFDWEANGHWRLKDHPMIFLEPTAVEKKAKMPQPLETDRVQFVVLGQEASDLPARQAEDLSQQFGV